MHVGIGRGLVAMYLMHPQSTVIAAVRDLSSSTSQSLSELDHASGSILILVKLDASFPTDASTAVQELQTKHHLTSIDVVIANAGISANLPQVRNVTAEDIYQHINVNVIGVVTLFQAVLPLLEKSTRTLRFVGISSSAGSIGGMELRPYPNASYGTSKAALNFMIRKIHFEHPELTAFPIDPGWVQTDMGNFGAKVFGVEKAEISVDESVAGIVKRVSCEILTKWS